MSEPSLLHASRSLLRRDMILAMRRKADVLNSLVFFLIVVSLFPLGVGPEAETLREIAPGVIWVAALLASMLSLGRLFADDHHDGCLEQMLILPHPLTVLVGSKVLAHWVLSGLPLVLLSPLLGMQLGMDIESIAVLMLTLLLGTPVLSLIGAVGAALTIGVRGGGVLISLLILPLYVPVLIFGAASVNDFRYSVDITGHLLIMGALLTGSLTLAPWATAAALRISLE